jgi:hypothetical protein
MRATDDFRTMVGYVWSIKRHIPLWGWLDKVVLGFLDYERAKAFYTDPTTAEVSGVYWTDGYEPNPYRYPGPFLPTGGIDRGIYTMTSGESYAQTMLVNHTVTTAEASAGTYTQQVPIFRYYDNGVYIGACVTGTDPTFVAVSEIEAGAAAATTGVVTAVGEVTATEGGTAWTLGDVHTITVSATGQLPGVPVNFTPTTGAGVPLTDSDVGGTGVITVGLATIQLSL